MTVEIPATPVTESAAGSHGESPLTDDKGRRNVHLMSAEECARETLIIQRALQDLIEGFFTDLKTGKLEMPGPMGMMLKMLTR